MAHPSRFGRRLSADRNRRRLGCSRRPFQRLALGMEQLTERTLLAVTTWDGEGDDGLWSTVRNWSNESSIRSALSRNNSVSSRTVTCYAHPPGNPWQPDSGESP